MRTFFPVIINLTAVIIGSVMVTLKNTKRDAQTQGEAVKTDAPCPNGVSG